MKILHVGAFEYYLFDEAVAETMEELGHEVIRFSFYNYVKGWLGKVERYLSWVGPLSYYMNVQLIKKIKKEQPDMVLVWRAPLISSYFVKKIKRISNAKLVSYNNDDPFSPFYKEGNLYQKLLWRNFRKTIPYFDINAVFRPHNLIDYNINGSQKSTLFPPYFIPKFITNTSTQHKKYDVVFIGLFTKDRLEAINFLLDNNIKVKLFGAGWHENKLSKQYSFNREIKAVRGKAYYDAIASSKICLAFLSKLNRDVYTYRSHEIPAAGTLMLSERSTELNGLYKEDKEAVYFFSKGEMLRKIEHLLANPMEMKNISRAGKSRAFKSGYDVRNTVNKFLNTIMDC